MEERAKLKTEIIKLLKLDKELVENHMEIIESLNGYSEYTKELKEKIFELNKYTRDNKWVLIGRFIFLWDPDKCYKKINFYRENLEDYFLIKTEKEKEKFLLKELNGVDEEKNKEKMEEISKKEKMVEKTLIESKLMSKIKINIQGEEYQEKLLLVKRIVKNLGQYKEDFKKGYEALEDLKKTDISINEIEEIFKINKDDRSILKKRYTLYERFKAKEMAVQNLPVAKLKSMTKKGVTASEQEKALNEVK